MKAINNSTSRIWDNKQLAQTIKECRANGFIINKDEDTIEIIDNNIIVLRSLRSSVNSHIVRIDGSYFGDCNFIEPVFIYVDNSNYIVSMTPEDIENNKLRSDLLRRFVIERGNLQKFYNYYGLQFHPLTKRNLTK